MQHGRGHDFRFDPLDDRGEHLHGAPALVQQRAVRDVGAHAGVDLVLTIQWKVVVELRDEDLRQQARPGHAAGDRTARGRRLHHLLTPAAGLLHPRNLNDPHLRRDQVEQLADVLTHHSQVTPTIGATGARVELPTFAGRCLRHARTSAGLRLGSRSIGRGWLIVFDRPVALFGDPDQQILQRQLQLAISRSIFSEDLPKACFCNLAIRRHKAWTSCSWAWSVADMRAFSA